MGISVYRGCQVFDGHGDFPVCIFAFAGGMRNVFFGKQDDGRGFDGNFLSSAGAIHVLWLLEVVWCGDCGFGIDTDAGTGMTRAGLGFLVLKNGKRKNDFWLWDCLSCLS